MRTSSKIKPYPVRLGNAFASIFENAIVRSQGRTVIHSQGSGGKGVESGGNCGSGRPHPNTGFKILSEDSKKLNSGENRQSRGSNLMLLFCKNRQRSHESVQKPRPNPNHIHPQPPSRMSDFYKNGESVHTPTAFRTVPLLVEIYAKSAAELKKKHAVICFLKHTRSIFNSVLQHRLIVQVITFQRRRPQTPESRAHQ